jgi:7 transmembrane receptor (rhodopsin family)
MHSFVALHASGVQDSSTSPAGEEDFIAPFEPSLSYGDHRLHGDEASVVDADFVASRLFSMLPLATDNFGANDSFNGTVDAGSADDASFWSPGLSDNYQLALILLYSITTSLAVLGNLIVIVVLAVGRRSKTDLRAFLLNLAIADLTMAVFCMPFTFTTTMLHNWIFGAAMCTIVLFLQVNGYVC